MKKTSVDALVRLFLELTDEKVANLLPIPSRVRCSLKMSLFEIQGLDVELAIQGDASVIEPVPSTGYINRVATLSIFDRFEPGKIFPLQKRQTYLSIGAVEFPRNLKNPEKERSSEFQASLRSVKMSSAEIPSHMWLPACVSIIQRMHDICEYLEKDSVPVAIPATT